MTNPEIAQLLRRVAAAYQILGENRFKIIAYERAADSIEHLTSETKDLWDNQKLGDIPGIGEAIAKHLDELFRTGNVRHFVSVFNKVPASVFPLLSVPGLGPKKAYKLVTELKLSNAHDAVLELERAANAGKVAPLEGFGEKSQADILAAIATYKRGQIKEHRMELSLADSIAQEVMEYLEKHASVSRVDALGSLRRQVSTIGDIDIAVATKKPEEVADYFVQFPHQKIVEKGPKGATLLLHNGRQVDLRVQKPESYGAMLQYFTGSKNHNIRLRSYGLTKGKSLNEYGMKDLRTGRMRSFQTEEEFYKELGLPFIPPELREDKGEIEQSLTPSGLPKLVEASDMKGDLHIHTNYQFESSHDFGTSSLAEHLDRAAQLGYDYIGISDHNPSITNHTETQIAEIMKRRKDRYEQLYSSWVKKVSKRVQIFIMCEVDILADGTLALPASAFDYVDAVIVSLHSSFTQEKKKTTERLLKALGTHPKVRILGHPTGRLLLQREGVDADWGAVFAECRKRDIALEINAYPSRLDLPDDFVFDAVKEGNKFCINTDSHAVGQMDMMRYGVSVARRGWCEKRDIVNTLRYNEFRNWLLKS